MPYTLSDLIECARCFVEETFPGSTADRIRLTFLDLKGRESSFDMSLLRLPGAGLRMEPRAADIAAWPEEEPEGNHKPLVHPCTTAIMEVLHQAGRPLTGTNLYRALTKYWREQRLPAYSEATVKNYLKILMDDETIENPHGARPAGYRLTDQESTSGTNPTGQ